MNTTDRVTVLMSKEMKNSFTELAKKERRGVSTYIAIVLEDFLKTKIQQKVQ